MRKAARQLCAVAHWGACYCWLGLALGQARSPGCDGPLVKLLPVNTTLPLELNVTDRNGLTFVRASSPAIHPSAQPPLPHRRARQRQLRESCSAN